MKTVSEYKLSKVKSDFEKVKISNSKLSEEYARQFYFDDLGIYESFFIMLLNKQTNITGYAKISQGGIAGTIVDPIIVAKYAIDSLSSSVILCHNHPSGNLTPSKQDLDLTSKIKSGLALFGIKVLDHIILTESAYYSMADEGTL
jgi:DNA repair protein RadC